MTDSNLIAELRETHFGADYIKALESAVERLSAELARERGFYQGVTEIIAERDRLRDLNESNWIARRDLAQNRDQWQEKAERLRAALANADIDAALAGGAENGE